MYYEVRGAQSGASQQGRGWEVSEEGWPQCCSFDFGQPGEEIFGYLGIQEEHSWKREQSMQRPRVRSVPGMFKNK